MFYLMITALLWAGDSVVKRKVEESNLDREPKSICLGRLLLQKVHNEGAILGVFKDKPNMVKKISMGMMAVIAAIYLNLLHEKGKTGLKIAFALTAAGAASNVTDRVRRHYVV
ncbi:signal peptidase II, partial [bacterium]|nr:signal peptidase II [bacterium]